MHADRTIAKETMRKLRELGEMEGIRLALAHVPIDKLGDETLQQLLIQLQIRQFEGERPISIVHSDNFHAM